MIQNFLSGAADRYEKELLENVIPFWENHCEDKVYGGYFTCLDRDGTVYDTEKYMWMQWRIVYMFALFYKNVRQKENYLRIAEQGFDFLTKHGKSPDGTYYFALNRQGVPSVAPYNIFSDCFAAMGAAALYQATGKEIYAAEARSAMDHYIARMDNPKGKWEKGLSGKPARLSHGHFMILANLASVMKEMLGTDEYENRADEAVRMVTDHFWNPEMRLLFENINTDHSFDLESCEGRFINPGHGLESMWFVMQYAERKNDPELIKKAADIVKGILASGTDKKYGGLYYFMDALNKPHLELQWDMKLWWPHCEAIIALLYAFRLTKDPFFMEKFKEFDSYTWSHFKDPLYPEWFAYLNRQGIPTHNLKGGKWKTFFHLPRMLYISSQQMRKITAE